MLREIGGRRQCSWCPVSAILDSISTVDPTARYPLRFRTNPLPALRTMVGSFRSRSARLSRYFASKKTQLVRFLLVQELIHIFLFPRKPVNNKSPCVSLLNSTKICRNLLAKDPIQDELIGRLHNPCLTVPLVQLLAFLALRNGLKKCLSVEYPNL